MARKNVTTLVNMYNQCKDDNAINSITYRTDKNHRMEYKYPITKFYYYSTCIVCIDDINKTITINNGGYSTSSTTQAINGYLELLPNLYDIIDERAQPQKKSSTKS